MSGASVVSDISQGSRFQRELPVKKRAKIVPVSYGEDDLAGTSDAGSVAGSASGLGNSAAAAMGLAQTVTIEDLRDERQGGLAKVNCHCCDAQLGSTMTQKDEKRAQLQSMYMNLRDKMPIHRLAKELALFFNKTIRRFTIEQGRDCPEWTAVMVQNHLMNCLQDKILMAIQDVRDWDTLSKKCGDMIFRKDAAGETEFVFKMLAAKRDADKMKYGILKHTRETS